MRRGNDMSWNDTYPNDRQTLTEGILRAEKLLRAISEANRAGLVHEIKDLAGQLGDLANYGIRARAIAIHAAKPLQVLPAELEEEVE